LFLFLLAFFALSLCGQVTIENGTYSDINASRTYRVYYPTGTAVSAKLPVVVIIHGGGWVGGDLNDSAITPAVCTNTMTVACWLAENGYVVYSIDYTLVSYVTGADLTITGTNTVSSASVPFTSADVDSALIVLDDNQTGWNIGGYTVQSVHKGVATLNASPGITGLQGGSFDKVEGSTLWPVQWQDCNCFLRYMAGTLGVTTPGDPNNVYLMGHSAGGQLVGVLGLGGNNAFSTNCEHSSTAYTVRGIISLSPPTDLVTLTSPGGEIFVKDLLGCIPGYQSCDSVAKTASITNYVGENLPPYISFSGGMDAGVPPANVQETSLDFAALNPPVVSQWVLFPSFYHDLDLFYYTPCSSDPDGGEPSPCGTAGMTFADMRAFWTPANLSIVAGNNQSVAPGTTAGTALAVSVTNDYPQAVSGAVVTFTISSGTGGASGTFNGAGSAQVVSNSNGLATAPALTVNSLPGTFSVTVSTTGGPSTVFSLTVLPSTTPAALTITSGNNQTIAAGSMAPTALAVSVTNQSGTPLSGVTITFTANAGTGGASGTFNGAATAQVLSNASGIATAPALTANSSAGTFTVTAATGGLSSSFSLTITALPAPGSVTITTGNYQSIPAGLSAGTPLAVSVLDQHGLALPNATVIFSVDAGAAGESGTFTGSTSASVLTNAGGMATAPTLTVNDVAGPFSVTASTGGLSTTFYLNVGSPTPAFGNVDTPVNNTSGIAGAVSVNGWALSPIGVQSVAIWRDPIPSEGSSLIYVGNATIVPGTRPDVATAYPGYPCNNCGWGYQLLTNELPNSNDPTGIGNGTYTLHVLVTDNTGQTTDIGGTTFGAANAASIIPFGTIDTPTPGQTVSGTIVNFGWALTPQPNLIPFNGSTIWVFIDNVRVGNPVYNQYRADIATLFPGLQNSNGAVGYYYIDTTKLANGLHTIAWSVTDSAGNAQGIGSRYFIVTNN
jgi:hypothetical protein